MIPSGVIVTAVSCWLVYEIGVGCVVMSNQLFRTGKKWRYVPWSVLHADDHEKYLEWREWKGERF